MSPAVLGLIFLLMSAFYAVFSPIWGWVADKMVSLLSFLLHIHPNLIELKDSLANVAPSGYHTNTVNLPMFLICLYPPIRCDR